MHPITLPNATTPTDLPTRWGELTLSQFERLTDLPEKSDVYNFLSVFLNLSPVEIMNLPAAFVNEQVLPVLEFAGGTVPNFESFTMPPSILFPTDHGQVQLPVPKSLDIVSFGQATDLGALLQDAEVPVLQKRLRALAIVFYPAYVSGDYDSDAIIDFAAKVCSHAVLEDALPITDFFLSSTTLSDAGTLASSSASPSTLTSGPPASKPWWRNGIRWPWSTPSLVATKPAGLSFSASPGAR
ncbi:MAG: hypothetical protein ACRYFZ_07255 [Janthinobacterium lividum]